MEKSPEKIKYFMYARKSSESEDRQIQSIEDQIGRLKLLANDLNLDVVKIYTEAKSAKKPHNRPLFDEMLKRIEKGEADGILCWQINRLSRNPIDSGKLGWHLQQGILKSIQTIDRQYLPDDNVLLFNIETGQANQFIIDLKKNSMRGMDGKADRGWLPSLAPLGYLNDKLEHVIREDTERFDLVRKMWDMMLTGNYTPSQIREIANKEWGFRTAKRKHIGGSELSNNGIYSMFGNIFYTGMFEWKGKQHTGNHKPMVTIEEYDRVQVLLGRYGKPRVREHVFAYTGVISCGVCGGMYSAYEMTKLVKKTGEMKSFVYYRATHKKGMPCENQKQLPLKNLEDQIELELEGKTILPEFRQWALEILNSRNDQEIDDRTKVYEMRHASMAEAQKELDSLTRMRYKELIDDEAFIKERDVLREKIAKFKTQLRETENRAERWIELTEKTFNFAAYARHAFLKGTLDEKREILTALGSNYAINDGKLSIIGHDWLVQIENEYPALEAEYRRIELDKTLTNTARNEALASLRTRWGALLDAHRTCLMEMASKT